MNLMIFPLGQTSFHFDCAGFLAEVSGVDGATRSFQILSVNQLIDTVQGLSANFKLVSNISEDEGFRSSAYTSHKRKLVKVLPLQKIVQEYVLEYVIIEYARRVTHRQESINLHGMLAKVVKNPGNYAKVHGK